MIHSIQTNSACLWTIQPGKPLPGSSKRKNEQGKGNYGACYLYASKLIANFFNDSPQSIQIQENDRKRLSGFRRTIHDFATTTWPHRALVCDYVSELLRERKTSPMADEDLKKWILANQKAILLKIAAMGDAKEKVKTAREFFKRYKESGQADIHTFYCDLFAEEKMTIFSSFLSAYIDMENAKECKRQEHEEFSKWIALSSLQEDFTRLSKQRQLSIIHQIFIDQIKELYQLTPASWTPLDSIDQLIVLLKNVGPVVTEGFLGSSYGPHSPTLSTSTSDYEMYEWQDPIKLVEQPKTAHTVVLVGAEKSPVPSVFLVDPIDPSLLEGKRKIYKLSYNDFCKLVLDSKGASRVVNQEWQNVQDRALKYLYYRSNPAVSAAFTYKKPFYPTAKQQLIARIIVISLIILTGGFVLKTFGLDQSK